MHMANKILPLILGLGLIRQVSGEVDLRFSANDCAVLGPTVAIPPNSGCISLGQAWNSFTPESGNNAQPGCTIILYADQYCNEPVAYFQLEDQDQQGKCTTIDESVSSLASSADC